MPSAKADYDPRPAATRLAAVQAVYELDMMDVTPDEVLASFAAERWRAADEDVAEELARPKPELLKELVNGVVRERARIDGALGAAMTKGRHLDDLEAVLLAILRTAVFELLERRNVPARTLFGAYATVGDAFFDEDGPQPKLIAGVLNTVARHVRPEEFEAKGEAAGT